MCPVRIFKKLLDAVQVVNLPAKRDLCRRHQLLIAGSQLRLLLHERHQRRIEADQITLQGDQQLFSVFRFQVPCKGTFQNRAFILHARFHNGRIRILVVFQLLFIIFVSRVQSIADATNAVHGHQVVGCLFHLLHDRFHFRICLRVPDLRCRILPDFFHFVIIRTDIFDCVKCKIFHICSFQLQKAAAFMCIACSVSLQIFIINPDASDAQAVRHPDF